MTTLFAKSDVCRQLDRPMACDKAVRRSLAVHPGRTLLILSDLVRIGLAGPDCNVKAETNHCQRRAMHVNRDDVKARATKQADVRGLGPGVSGHIKACLPQRLRQRARALWPRPCSIQNSSFRAWLFLTCTLDECSSPSSQFVRRGQILSCFRSHQQTSDDEAGVGFLGVRSADLIATLIKLL